MSTNGQHNTIGVSLEDQAGFWSKILMGWLNPLFKVGAERRRDGRNLEHEDIGVVAAQDRASVCNDWFTEKWSLQLLKVAELEKEKAQYDSDPGSGVGKQKCTAFFGAFSSKKKEKFPEDIVNVWAALFSGAGYWKVALGLFYAIVGAAMQFGPIILLGFLVRHFSGQDTLSDQMLWLYVSLLLVLPLVGTLAQAQCSLLALHVGIQVRTALTGAIYRKALKLSPAAKQQCSTGQIMNMFSSDTASISSMLYFASLLILAPAQIGVALWLVFEEVGYATFVGLGFMFFLIPIQAGIMIGLHFVKKQILLIQDKRVKLMNEILAGIRVLKYYAWELAFSGKVVKLRDDELVELKKIAYILAFGFSMLLLSAPVIQPILIFFAYVKLGNQLDAAKAFTTIALFNLMRFPFAFLPMGLAQFAQARVSMQRIRKFLLMEELDNYVNDGDEWFKSTGNPEGTIVVQDASMGWLTLKDVALAEEKLKAELEAEAKKTAAATEKNNNKWCGKAYEAVEAEEAEENGKKDEGDATGVEMVKVDTAAAPEGDGPNRGVETLSKISFSLKKGELLAVVGNVGSGKSSLLNGLIGELNLQEGSVGMRGSVAYCEQKPWILNATLKDNVLFGLPYDEAKFDHAIAVCCLEDDLVVLPGGVDTEIGERGINLSGGQKARVALARAVYRNADVYLLDDPLSAVDAHVCEHLFKHCIKGALRDKTVVLVTHQAHLLAECDKICIIDNGKQLACDTYPALERSNIDLNAYIPQKSTEDDADDANTPSRSRSSSVSRERGNSVSRDRASSLTSRPTSLRESTGQSDKALVRKDREAKNAEGKADKLIEKEERGVGNVNTTTYLYYIRSGGWWMFVGIAVVMILGKVCELNASFYLVTWSKDAVDSEREGDPLSSEENINYVNMYAILSCASIFTLGIRAYFSAEHRIAASATLHKDLLSSVMAAPTSFFDVTPLGRILNRFSSDMLTIDEQLSSTLSQLINTGFNTIQALAAVAGATKGTFMILLVPLTWIYARVTTFFKCTSTEVERLRSTSKSPIFSDFSQALNGMASIRAFKEESRFTDNMEASLDVNTAAEIIKEQCFVWLCIRLDFIGAMVSFFVGCLAAATAGSGFIPAGYVGLGLASAFDMVQFMKHGVRMVAAAESQFNSVERIMYYIETITAEDSDEKEHGVELPPPEWPSRGEIVANNVSMAYRDGPLVLKDLSFEISSAEKVGVCGRTGSGKSSLMVGLFRIEPLSEGGSIVIDGIDCKKVPLSVLRSKLGIIPQDPVMFSASVRYNLDPFALYSDEEIWNVLDSVDMKSVVGNLPGKLQEEVAEGGENFSAGQRQLICIARALLRKPKILVLDEATASVDNETDALIQRMIRDRFKDCTVLTIAHRLHTIVDADKIMVLANGYLGEFDSPDVLLKREPDQSTLHLKDDEASVDKGGAQPGLFRALWERHLKSHKNEIQSAMPK